MCGIAGIYHTDHRAVAPADLERMHGVLRHRGPDGQGFMLLDSRAASQRPVALDDLAEAPPEAAECDLGFAHRRLAIIDLSPTGHQPMATDDGAVWLIYNGEIYNHVELRADLLARGHRFRGRSDTEVLLRAYEEWGPDCVSRFNGMWAFALWDGRRRQLFCSRDRFGVKPFYYAFDGRRFVFASEIKGLLAAGVTARPNDAAIHAYLHAGFGYVDVADETFFAGIVKLPPASNLFVSDGTIRIERYWRLDESEPASKASSAGWYELFEDAVRLRLRSDVRVGGALSGGLDSSAVTCVAARLLGAEHYAAFSVCYDDQRYDERRFIVPVVRQTGVRHYPVFPTPADFADSIDRVLWHQDEPFPDLNILSQWVMYARVREEGVKVFLNGHGGDETLGGYVHHHLAFLVDLLRRGSVGRFVRELRLHADHGGTSSVASLKRVLHRLAAVAVPGGASAWRALRGTDRGYLQPEFAERHAERVPTPRAGSLLRRELLEGIHWAPLPAWLHLEDRNSMAFSIESRTPFLDYRLVEFLFRLPSEALFHGGFSKHILRDAMRGVLPEEVRCRRDKRGFQSAAEQWFRTDLAGFVRDVIESRSFAARGYLDPGRVREAFERHRRGDANLRFAIWSWVCLELWFRAFIDEGGLQPRAVPLDIDKSAAVGRQQQEAAWQAAR